MNSKSIGRRDIALTHSSYLDHCRIVLALATQTHFTLFGTIAIDSNED